MINRKSTKFPSLPLWTLTPDTSPQTSPAPSVCDADEATMSAEDFIPSRPLSVNLLSGSYYPERPTLAEVLANTAPPPWTLSAFMAYLSQNHCLETLEFTMEAERYGASYHEVAAHAHGIPLSSDNEQVQELRLLWQRLLDAYILPGAPREVNLPSEVRDEILSLSDTVAAPPPETLNTAVKVIHELMEDSIFLPFLNSFSNFAGAQTYTIPYRDHDTYVSGPSVSLDERDFHRHRSKQRHSPPSSTMDLVTSRASTTSHYNRPSSSNLTSALGRSGNKLITQASHISTASGDPALTDDSGSASSPGKEPMTPPTTPPSSDIGIGTSSPRSKPENTWKKMGARLGWKKKSAGTLREHRFPATEEE